ncbi:MAG: transketolase C-terminal domain-containing protein [Candidatus Bathyarchaeia archaeon]
MVFEVMVGNMACATGAKLCRVQVATAFPVTPQTTITEYMSQFVANGELDCEFVNVEGELSSQVVVQAASRVGVRTFCCCSGPGQLYMHHPMHGASSSRLPVVMATVHRGNRGMQPDHTDTMSQMWTGWMQWECENSQEILDTCIMAYKVAEDRRVLMPILFGYDGYILSYTAEPVEVPDQEDVDDFLPPYKPVSTNLPEHYNIEAIRRAQAAPQRGGGMAARRDPQASWRMSHELMLGAKEVIKEVNEEFGKRFGRKYGNGLVEEYKCEDAEAIIVAMGTIASTARAAIDKLWEEGKPVGLVKLKCFLPFPNEDFQRISKNVPAIGMIDRNICVGCGGMVFSGIRNALYDLDDRPKVLGFHAGMSGAEVMVADIMNVGEKTLNVARGGKAEPLVEWVFGGGGEEEE